MRFIYLFFVLYFSGFFVAPISALLPCEQEMLLEGKQSLLEKRKEQISVLLYDIAMWEVLKKTKLPDDLKRIEIYNNDNNNGKLNISAKTVLSLTDTATFHEIYAYGISAYIDTRSSIDKQYNSGLSPPPIA
ncbi:MAG: hypothetical protein EPN22_00755 [Nitrospirae bacterium]|nr:MAG: hypothetical protein EPN22_00755 [Nitrospirota bacterium]